MLQREQVCMQVSRSFLEMGRQEMGNAQARGKAAGAGWRGRLSGRPLHPTIPLGSTTLNGVVL